MTAKRFPFPFPLDPVDIARKRESILSFLCAHDKDFCATPIRALNQATLDAMLRAYDERYLCGFLDRKPGILRVTYSSRLTSSAGKFVCVKGPFGSIKHAEIRMSSDFFLRISKGPFYLNGLTALTPQEAFLMVFEHELCHALEALFFRSTGHSDRFRSLAFGLFGHTETKHRLPTRREDAAEIGLFVGQQVSFAYHGEILSGIIAYIGKTATVMVPFPGGMYRSSNGIRYEKYRVPLSRLKTL